MDEFSAAVARSAASLSPTIARVARFLDRHRALVLASSAAQIASKVGTSDATVIRAIQALGFDGLPDLKRALAAVLDEQATPAGNMRRTLDKIGKDSMRAVREVLESHWEGLEALRESPVQTSLLNAIEILSRADRIGVFGIGPSAHLARYVALQLGRVGKLQFVLDATGYSLADQMLRLRNSDALLLLSYGQPYREVLALVDEAERLRLDVVLVTDAHGSKLARRATVVLPAKRGRTDRVALHATTLAALEAVILGLAAVDRERTLQHLSDLDRLRGLLRQS